MQLPALLRPTTGWFGRSLEEISDQKVRDNAQRIWREIMELSAPLIRVQSFAELQRYLDGHVSAYLDLKTRLVHLLPLTMPRDELMEAFREAHRNQLSMVEADRDVLTHEQREFLVSILDSQMEMTLAFIEASEDRQARLVDLAVEFSGPFQRADMCLLTLLAILAQEVADWRPGSVPLLCKAIDDYMDEVETVILRHDPELNESLGERGELVSLEKVRADLGLSG